MYYNSKYVSILKYALSSPLVGQQIYVDVHTIDAAIYSQPINEYSSIKLQMY